MRMRFTNIPTQDPRTDHVMVRSTSGAGYWGRGETVADAIAAAQYMGSQDEVYVMDCDGKAHCDAITGAIRYNHRGPIYRGKIMRDRRDVLVSRLETEADLDP